MGVLKYSSKEDKHFLILELSKKEQVNEGIVNALRSSGFMTSVPFEYNEKKRAFRYDLIGLISLRVRLGSAITINEFYLLIANLYRSVLQLSNDLQIPPSFLDWAPDSIFLDVMGNIYFLVYPLNLKTVEGSGFYGLVRTLLKNAKPFQSVDERGLQRLLGFLEMVERKEVEPENFIYNLGQESLRYRSENLLEYSSPQLKLILEGVEAIEEELAPEVVTEVVGGVELDLTALDTEMIERTGLLDESSDDFDEGELTSVLDDSDSVVPIRRNHKVGYLIRPTGESFELDSRSGVDTWVFGKRPKAIDGVEESIAFRENKYMSGTHFKIIYEEEESTFYVEDMDSTNGTWLKSAENSGSEWRSEERIFARDLKELHDGDTLKIAKEEVTFKVKEV